MFLLMGSDAASVVAWTLIIWQIVVGNAPRGRGGQLRCTQTHTNRPLH